MKQETRQHLRDHILEHVRANAPVRASDLHYEIPPMPGRQGNNANIELVRLVRQDLESQGLLRTYKDTERRGHPLMVVLGNKLSSLRCLIEPNPQVAARSVAFFVQLDAHNVDGHRPPFNYVGPFSGVNAAHAWASRQTGLRGTYNVVPLTHPEATR